MSISVVAADDWMIAVTAALSVATGYVLMERSHAPAAAPQPAQHAVPAAAVALPHRSGGRVWRIARPFDGSVLREISETDVGSNVVIVFKALRPGAATLSYALTRGETTKALEARTFAVRIR